jgi:RNA polymerase sigma factor (TIGR02999 family)
VTPRGAVTSPTAPPTPTALLQAWGRGEATALHQLLPLVYEELRHVARRQMRREREGHTLQPSALVNEPYLRLMDVKEIDWRDRHHFFAIAARIMRRILVDAARTQGYQKRGGGLQTVSLDEALGVAAGPPCDLVALEDALNALAAFDPRKCQVVELRFFGGLSVEEAAQALHVSIGTIMRDWRLARAWLARELEGRRDHDP